MDKIDETLDELQQLVPKISARELARLLVELHALAALVRREREAMEVMK